jgi:3-oxoacyl-[acyl-carrier protein] reductase
MGDRAAIMDLELAGKSALVTGGSRGIGRGIADALLAEGAKVAICARDVRGIEPQAGFLALACDLSKAADVERLVPCVADALGAIDILVINGGGPPLGELDDLPRATWEEWFQTLWMTTVELVNAVLPSMVERRFGRILLVGSVAAREPLKNLVLSNSFRAGLLGLLKSVSTKVAADGVTVNAILPGVIDTRVRSKDVDGASGELFRSIPAGRLGTTKEVGALAAFLVSTRAGYMTGQAIACDGGMLRGT